MNIKRIKYSVIFVVMFFSWVGVAHAGLEITEIMYNSKGADIDWVEIYNPDNSDVDITKIKLLISNDTSNHDIKGYSGSQYLHKEEFGVIVVGSQISSFLSKWGSSAILFTSSFSLPNLKDGEEATVSINNGNKNSPLDSVVYTISDGGNGNGNSLSGDLEELTPTPGTANSSSNSSSDNSLDNNTDNSVDETIDPIPLVKDNPAILKITTKIISPKIVTAGLPFSLSSLTTTNRGETYAVGKFVWNFGDGMVREVKEANPFEYIYQYPGDYALTLSYYNSTFSVKPDAVDRMTIKVVPAGINISSVGNASDPFVEIENKSSYEIILSNWVVTAGIHYFIIPEGTTLLPNKKIKLSPKITGFVGEDLNSIVISNQSKEIISTYPIQIIKPIQNKILSVSANNPQEIPLLKEPQVINLNDLGASAENTGINIPNSTYPLVGLLVVIGLGVVGFLLIKKKRNVGDYVEQGISAKDMTIIE